MKRDIELQKYVTHTSIWLGKKESDQKCMIPKKPKACSSSEMSKISGINLTMRCYDSKKIKWYEEYRAKWKVSKLCNQVMWEVIYAYFYNWDRSHYLVLVVYGLVELIIEASHLIKDYLIVDIHTHHTCQCSMNAIFICVIVLD